MKFEYPSELPVSAARSDIAEAVKSSQVVIVSGQTGSGKTTQLPKILLELGRGSHGRQIVHTQPRRLAARTVAERIASEMGVTLGEEVGYQVRFTDESSPKTHLRVVTDGILLAQIQRDPKLMQYDTIIIDEAHERSLNIDFLLGYLTALLPKRRDLKLVITSATIDSVKFQEHFEHALHTKVPVIEVSGRTYPVQIVYEPLGTAPALMRSVPGFETGAMPGDADYEALSAAPDGRDGRDSRDTNVDMPTAVARACAELVIHSTHDRGPRDILVFASGERDIHDFENALRRHYGPRAADMRRPDAIEIVPLFARLSSKEQHKVFEPHTHQRIVIATNVAETSLTVPGIRYVVDPGTARIFRYSKRAKVQRLPIEPISQASANQRSGRCGRIADGIAIRLYSREDFETRRIHGAGDSAHVPGRGRTAHAVGGCGAYGEGCDGFRFHRSAGYEGRVGWFQRADRAEGRGAQTWRGGVDAYRPSAGTYSDRRAFGPYGHRGSEEHHAEHVGRRFGGGRVPELAGSARTA